MARSDCVPTGKPGGRREQRETLTREELKGEMRELPPGFLRSDPGATPGEGSTMTSHRDIQQSLICIRSFLKI